MGLIQVNEENIFFGVEIETQNCTSGECPSQYDLDPDDYCSEIAEEFAEAMANTSSRHLRDVARRGEDFVITFEEMWDRVYSNIVDNWSSESEPEELPLQSQWGTHWAKHGDGSVKGYEYVFKGKKTKKEAFEALEAFPFSEAEIDSECSFHVHVSWKGLETIGEQRQARLYAAMWLVLSREDGKYENVKDVLKTRAGHEDWCQQYYAFDVGSSKYRAIARREETFEFRVFGGVDNRITAKEILDFVLEVCTESSSDVCGYLATLEPEKKLLKFIEEDFDDESSALHDVEQYCIARQTCGELAQVEQENVTLESECA